MPVSVHIDSVCPWRHVTQVESVRVAQITARLLAERFLDHSFGFAVDTGIRRPDCHPAIRDAALSLKVQNLIAAELVLEEAANPGGLPKWCAFRCRDGGVYANPDHHVVAIRQCRDHPDVIEERAIYAERPSPGDVLACFREAERAP